jgi:hypothetical protein
LSLGIEGKGGKKNWAWIPLKNGLSFTFKGVKRSQGWLFLLLGLSAELVEVFLWVLRE